LSKWKIRCRERGVLVRRDRAEATGDAATPSSLEETSRRLDRDGRTSPSPQRHGQSPTGSVGTNRSLSLHSQTPLTACQKSVDFLIFPKCGHVFMSAVTSPSLQPGAESPSRIDHRSDPDPMKKGEGHQPSGVRIGSIRRRFPRKDLSKESPRSADQTSQPGRDDVPDIPSRSRSISRMMVSAC
jgi:hypothetical protein